MSLLIRGARTTVVAALTTTLLAAAGAAAYAELTPPTGAAAAALPAGMLPPEAGGVVRAPAPPRAAGRVGARVARDDHAPKQKPPAANAARSAASQGAAAKAAACPDGSCYFYGVGSQSVSFTQAAAFLRVRKPYLATADKHTLAELAVRSADGQQIVEIGWTVDRLLNGDDLTHLFVYRWVDGKPSCYNLCEDGGFVPASEAVWQPGDALPVPSDASTLYLFQISHRDDGWWLSYGGTDLGYYPDKIWSSQGVTFTEGALVQAFGEVDSVTDQPCTDMGNGLPGATDTGAFNNGAAQINGVQYSRGDSWFGANLNVRVQPSTATKMYSTRISDSSTRTFAYGGSGAC